MSITRLNQSITFLYEEDARIGDRFIAPLRDEILPLWFQRGIVQATATSTGLRKMTLVVIEVLRLLSLFICSACLAISASFGRVIKSFQSKPMLAQPNRFLTGPMSIRQTLADYGLLVNSCNPQLQQMGSIVNHQASSHSQNSAYLVCTDLLIRTFSYLCVDDHCRLSRVNRLFCLASQSSILWEPTLGFLGIWAALRPGCPLQALVPAFYSLQLNLYFSQTGPGRTTDGTYLFNWIARMYKYGPVSYRDMPVLQKSPEDLNPGDLPQALVRGRCLRKPYLALKVTNSGLQNGQEAVLIFTNSGGDVWQYTPTPSTREWNMPNIRTSDAEAYLMRLISRDSFDDFPKCIPEEWKKISLVLDPLDV